MISSGKSCLTRWKCNSTTRTGRGRALTAATSQAGPAGTPLQLFGDYLSEQGVADERVERMFAELLDDLTDNQTG